MAVLSLLYVSRCAVSAGLWSSSLADIQSTSINNNSKLNITGLLIATPDWFAQLLEGPPENVDRVMMSILADPRHTDVKIVRRKMVDKQRGLTWRLARFDRSAFEANHVAPALESAHTNKGDAPLRPLDRLIDRILTDCDDETFSREF